MEVFAVYAIIETGGFQFRVEPDMKLSVPRMDAEEEATVRFDQVLLVSGDDGSVSVGTPLVENAFVEASVVRHFRGDKVEVFKRKRRKGYMRKTGHRQDLTEVLIQSINGG
jgi:large subunit ribosomal protein L21